jgi:hypothetical protein
LLPIPLEPDTDPNVLQKISHDYRIVDSRDGFALYERVNAH